jgi:PIN domain nuclease of toxin-antitoxin system
VRLLLDTHIWIWSHVEPERLTNLLNGTGFKKLANR